MDSTEKFLKQVAVRALIVTGIGLGIGFLIFRLNIFKSSMPTFQVTMACVTVGVFYAMLKGYNLRNAMAVLLLWYLISNIIDGPRHYWMMIVNLVYIAGLSLTVYLYMLIIRKGLISNIIIRIALFVVITAIMHALIVYVLALFSLPKAVAQPYSIMLVGFHNLELGTLIGLALGIGIEVADYTVCKLPG